MSERDPVDELLRRAFARDGAQAASEADAAPGTVVETVMRRLRARQRARLWVLSGAIVAASSLLVALVQPALNDLMAAFPQNLDTSLQNHTVLLLAGCAVLATWVLGTDTELG